MARDRGREDRRWDARDIGPLFLTYLPVVILVVVALLQIDRAHSQHQTPWKGGGFGMFSTNDRGSNRSLRLIGHQDGRQKNLRLLRHPEAERLARQTLALPSDDNLFELAHILSRQEALARLEALRVEVWRSRFDSATRKVALDKLNGVMLERRN